MVEGKVVSREDIVSREVGFLWAIYHLVEQAGLALKTEQMASFGVVQGALRAAYNGLMEVVYSEGSDCLTEPRKGKLEDLSNSVFQIREKLVKGTQVLKRDLKTIVSENNTYKRLSDAMADLRECLVDWYGVEVSNLD